MSTQGAGPYVPAEPYPILPVQPVELLLILLTRDVNPSIVVGTNDAGQYQPVWVGGADNTAQQSGCVVLMPGGTTQMNPHLPLKYERIQVRCMAHSIYQATQIGNHVYDLLHVRHREIVTQPSTGNRYLIHHTQCVAAPSGHWDSATTWESLAFYEIVVHTQPIS